MLTVGAACSQLETAIPLSKAAEWDAVGLQVGDRDADANPVAVCHEVTDEVVEAAKSVGLLVSYHPLIFAPTKSFVAGPSAPGRAFRLASAGTALYSVHTAFDVAAAGCAVALGAELGLSDAVGFGPNWSGAQLKLVTFIPPEARAAMIEALSAAGAGTIGRYHGCAFSADGVGSFSAPAESSPHVGRPGESSHAAESRLEMLVPAGRRDAVAAALVSAHLYEEPPYEFYDVAANAGFVGRVGTVEPQTLEAFAADVSARLHTAVRYSGARMSEVARVAVVPGSGAGFAVSAAAAGADVLVTGDVSHHQAAAASASGIAVIDAGHAATERPGLATLYSLVSTMFTETIDLTGINPDPWSHV